MQEIRICENQRKAGRRQDMWEIVLDSLLDTAKLVPFLLLTYMAMEYLEHQAGGAAARLVRRAGWTTAE